MPTLRYFIVLFMLCLPHLATADSSYREGVHYKVLKQSIPAVAPTGKIEVDTVFWYGCPHCYDLAKLQVSWKKGVSKDVALVDIPVIFGKPWQAHAQLYYTLEDMKLLDKAHFPVFEAVQNQGRRLDNEKDIAAFLSSRFAVKSADFERIYNSFGVKNQTQKASSISRGAQLTGVPAIIVGGRYVVDPAMAGNLENMLKITDFLVQKQLKEQAGKQQSGQKADTAPGVKPLNIPAKPIQERKAGAAG